MSEDLDLRSIDQIHEPDARFRARLRRLLEDEVQGPAVSNGAPRSDFGPVELEPAPPGRHRSTSDGRRARVAVIGVLAAAAALAAIVLVVSRREVMAPADTPPPPATVTGPSTSTTQAGRPAVSAATPLHDPTREEVALASNTVNYLEGSGHVEVTAGGNFVALRSCDAEQAAEKPCEDRRGWAYMTGGSDTAGVHYGLLGAAEYLVVAALDDRLFVATAPADPAESAADPPAWLIDSVTGRRGALRWRHDPMTVSSPEQVLVLFPAHPNPYYQWNVGEFLPRVVDTRDWTIAPLAVPEEASPAVPISQRNTGRIWLGTAPEDGEVGLAYTDDGGTTWTHVELPPELATPSEGLSALEPGHDELFTIAASGDRVAVATAWGANRTVFVTADAGRSWSAAATEPLQRFENGKELFVLADGTLMLVMTVDPYIQRLELSTSASDWSQLTPSNAIPGGHAHVDVNQQGIVVHYGTDMDPPAVFSTDLHQWWTIPGIPSYTAG